MKTLKLRIKDKHVNQLNKLAGSVNYAWNYVNDLSYKHLRRTGKFFSAYDLNTYTKGSGEFRLALANSASHKRNSCQIS